MDLKALIAKMDHIESKQILNEGFPTVADATARADKEKTTGKFDKKELSTGTQYTRKSSTFDDGGKDSDQKKADKKKKNESTVSGGIAQALLAEFGMGDVAEADSPRAQYDQFKADDAKAAAITRIQSLLKPGGRGVERLGQAIDPKTGVIYYGTDQGMAGVTPMEVPFKHYQQGQDKAFYDMLKSAGLEVKPFDKKGLFGTSQIAMVDPAALANLGKTPTPAPTAGPLGVSPQVNVPGSPTAAPVAGNTDPSKGPVDYSASSTSGNKLPNAAAALAAEPAAVEKGSKPTTPQSTTQEKMDRFVYLMNKKKSAVAPAPVKEMRNESNSLVNLMAKLKTLEESNIAEALEPEEEQELQAISKEVVDTVSSGAEGIPPEVMAAVKEFQGATASTNTAKPSTASSYKGSAGAQAIQKLNPAIKDVNKIQVGQQLKMPDGSTYNVKAGDTLDKIAKGAKPAADQMAKAPAAEPAPAAAPTPAPTATFPSALPKQAAQPAGSFAADTAARKKAANPMGIAKEELQQMLAIAGLR